VAHTIMSKQAMINAAGLPEALVTLVAILSKNKENFFDLFFLLFIFIFFLDIKRKTQAN
jgi:hypothetical protein